MTSVGGVDRTSDGLLIRRCYIDGCGKQATYVWHSYPDDVVLCDEHGSRHRPDLLEKRCTGLRCELCDD